VISLVQGCCLQDAPRRRPASGLNAFTDAALENKLQHIVSLLAERRGAAQVRAINSTHLQNILLGLEPSEITASEYERDAEEPQHTCKLAARLLNKSSDAEPASSDGTLRAQVHHQRLPSANSSRTRWHRLATSPRAR
jgi:hypothetical protein